MTLKFALPALVAATVIAGCARGTPEYAALPDTGPLTPTRLQMANGTCRMRLDDKISTDLNHNMLPDVGNLSSDQKNCYLSQGIDLKGWRQKDGSLTSTPIGG